MNPRYGKLAVSGLRWVLGLVVLLESAYFALSSAAAHQFAKTAVPSWIPLTLGGTEVIAALLFLVPASSLIGGYALLLILAAAAAIHVLLGRFDIGSLVVYGMGVIVCITHRNKRNNRGAV